MTDPTNGAYTDTPTSMSGKRLHDSVRDVVRDEVGRALEELSGMLPNPSAPVSRSLLSQLRSAFPAGNCPVCRCPDYRWRRSATLRERPRFGPLVVGIMLPGPREQVLPKETWVCGHCEADQQFLQGPVMWGELLDLRESVVVDNLSYEDFCKKELELFKRYMTPEDVALSDQMASLASFASFTVEYDGQRRSLRTGLLIRRFRILQILRHTTPADHQRLRGVFGPFG